MDGNLGLPLVRGMWKVLSIEPPAFVKGKPDFVGSRVHFTVSGKIDWFLPEGFVPIPLTHCDSYEVLNRGAFINNGVVRFATHNGHVLDYNISRFSLEAKTLVVNRNGTSIRFQRLSNYPEKPTKPPFTFLPALENGYFADLDLISENNKVFKVHVCILKASAPEFDWSTSPPPLSGLPEDILGTILHYLYAECLPMDLSKKTAEKVVEHLSAVPELSKLSKLCASYVKHISYENQILEVLEDIQKCATKMAESFTVKNLKDDPDKLCFAIKSAAKEAAIAILKLLVLCAIYSSSRKELVFSANEEIIRFIQSKVPSFMLQLKTFLLSFCSAFSGLQSNQRQDLASYLVPEVETALDLGVTLLQKFRNTIDSLMEIEMEEEERNVASDASLYARKCNTDLHLEEVMHYKCFLQRVGCMKKQLIQRKESFKLLSHTNKVRSLARNIEQLIEELPIFLLRLEEVSGALDHKFEWDVSQFSFKVAVAKVCQVIQRLSLNHKEGATDFMIELCRLVERDAFFQCMVTLGFLGPTDVPTVNPSEQASKPCSPKRQGQTLNLTADFICSRSGAFSDLAEAAGELLERSEDADMVFEVVEASGVTPFPAHRVIVASRCDWFRRALLSGMQEDIQRRIEVHDTNPTAFSHLLKFLYTGCVDSASLTADHLVELLLLGDRYNMSDLKLVCEKSLRPHLDVESVGDYLILADRFNAMSLKKFCLEFITEKELFAGEPLSDLPDHLKLEVHNCYDPGKARRIFNPTIYKGLSAERSNAVAFRRLRASMEFDSMVNRLRTMLDADVPREELERVLVSANMDLNRALSMFPFANSRNVIN